EEERRSLGDFRSRGREPDLFGLAATEPARASSERAADQTEHRSRRAKRVVDFDRGRRNDSQNLSPASRAALRVVDRERFSTRVGFALLEPTLHAGVVVRGQFPAVSVAVGQALRTAVSLAARQACREAFLRALLGAGRRASCGAVGGALRSAVVTA